MNCGWRNDAILRGDAILNELWMADDILKRDAILNELWIADMTYVSTVDNRLPIKLTCVAGELKSKYQKYSKNIHEQFREKRHK